MVAAKIRLDLNGKKGPDIWARIGEDATRQVVIKPGFYNDEGEFEQLVIDAEDIFAKFRVVKPDGTFVIYDASLYTPTSNPAEFVVTLTEEMSQVKGVGYYDLRIGDGETPDTFLYSASGRFIIDDDMITDEMIESVASVNGYVFPDDFLTSEALEEVLDDYATMEYVNDAIEEVNPLHEYSTVEQKVGKWIDGADLYEKTYIIENLATGYRSFTTDLVNVDTIFLYSGHAVSANKRFNSACATSYYGSAVDAATFELFFNRANESSPYNIDYRIGTSIVGGTAYVTIRYTKSA